MPLYENSGCGENQEDADGERRNGKIYPLDGGIKIIGRERKIEKREKRKRQPRKKEKLNSRL